MTKKEVLAEISQYLKQAPTESFFINILKTLIELYKKLQANITIDEYTLNHRNHSLSFKKFNYPLFFDIELTQYDLILRFEHIEYSLFKDDEVFIEKNETLLNCFLKGDYKMIYYFNPKGKWINTDLYWDNPELQIFNRIDKKKKEIAYTEEIIGQCFLED